MKNKTRYARFEILTVVSLKIYKPPEMWHCVLDRILYSPHLPNNTPSIFKTMDI